MTNLFTAKKLSVPGLLDDQALREQLKQFGDNQKAEHKMAPPPTAATDMADRVAREYISVPSARAAREVPRAPVPRSPSDRSPVERAVIGSPIGPLGLLGPGLLMAEQFGTLNAEERQAEADARAVSAREQETAFRNKAALRAQLRDMPTEEAERLGLPIAPAPITEGEKEILRQQDEATVAVFAEKAKAADAAAKDPTKQPTQTWWLNAAQVGVRSAAEMGVSMAKLPPIVWEQYEAAITGSSEKSLPREWLDKVDTALTQMLPGDKARSKDFVTQLASGMGSMAAFMVAGYLGAAVGLPVGLSTGALGAATEGVQLYEEAEQFDATGLQKFLALLAGAGLGATEAIPIDRMFMRVDAANGGIVRRLLKTTAAGSLEEFIQETSQAVGEDVVAKYLYDEERKFDLKEYAQRGLVGAITGGIASGGVGAIAEIAGDSDVVTPTDEREAIVNTAVAELQSRFEALVGAAEGTAGVTAGVDIALPMQETQLAATADGAVGAVADAAAAGEQPVGAKAAAKGDVGVAAEAATSLDEEPMIAGQRIPAAPAIETPEFKEWFGDSKVRKPRTSSRDTTPKPPLIVYHGTRGDFSAFDKAKTGTTTVMGIPVETQRHGIFFAEDPEFASSFAQQGERRGLDGGNVIPAYLSIQNPLWVSDDGALDPADIDRLAAVGVDRRWLEQYAGDPRTFWEAFDGADGAFFVDSLREAGFDGVRMLEIDPDVVEGDGTRTVWVAFEPTQIKSINNRGTFSKTDPDILASVAVPATRTIEARGGSLPVNEDGLVELTHWSDRPLDVIDPARRGTGPLVGEERRRLGTPGADPMVVDRSYYGAGTPPTAEDRAALKEALKEARKLPVRKYDAKTGQTTFPRDAAERAAFRKFSEEKGYVREGGLGEVRHTVYVDPNRLYNWYEDPLGLRAGLDKTLTASEQVTQYERAIRDAGFDGVFFNRSRLGQTAIMFTPEVPVGANEMVDAMRYEPAERGDFDGELTPELFQRPGWAVVTAMKEALGSAETPQNAALLAKMREELKGTDAIEISGMYKGVPQGASWIVFMPEAEALAMGRRYDQESILTNRGLVYGDGSVTPAVHDSTVVGEAAKREDFYSVLPGDRAFSMGLDFSTTIPAPEADAMATASRRGRYEGEQGRPGAGVPERPAATPGADGENDINLSRMSRNFVRLLNLTARQGRLTLKGSQIMGQYSRRSAVVRLRTWGDLSTLVHEGAHAFHDSMSPLLKAFVDRNANDFMDVGTQLYAGDLTYVPKDQHVREGFAEFFRVYTLNRQFVDSKYPRLTAEFTALLEAEAPQVKAGLDLLGAQFAAWLQLPSTQLLRNMVEPGIKATGINAAIKELRDVGFKTWYSEFANELLATSINRYASLNKLVNDMLNIGEANQGKAIDLKRADDPRVLIRLARNTGGRAMVQLTDGVYAYRGLQPTTRSLRDALLISQGVDPTKSPRSLDQTRLQDFDTYLVALRSIDEYRRMQEGKIERPPVAATLGDVQQTARDLEAKYGAAFTEAAVIVHEYGMALWKKQFDAGLMTKETYLDGLERRFYAPLQRDMSDKNNLSLGPGSLFGGRSIVKRFRGSDRNIISPMTTLMHKTFALERIIAQNDTLKAMALLSDRAGKAGAFVERVPSSVLTAKTFTVKEVARQLTKDDSLSETDAQDLMTLLEASIEDGSTIKLFRPEQASAYGENVLFYWENGKLAAIQLKDGSIGVDIVNMFNGLGRENMHVALEMIAMTSSAFRSAITAWPDFLLVNFVRDQMSAWIINDVGFKPFVTGFKGMGDELRQNQWSKMYNATMGIMGGMNVATLHDARVARDLGALRGKGYIAKAFNDGGLPGAIKGMARIVELTETGTRLGIFRKAYERAKADGLTDWEAGIEASYTATDYIDFGLNGSKMLVARRTIPFLNAQLQSLYKMLRTLGADEVRQRKGLRFALKAFFKDTRNMELSRVERQAVVTGRKAWIKMVSLGLLSAALHFLFEDDPDYQEAGEYLRTTGWVIPLGDGRIFYIPKPFELALVANAVERGLESAAGDPEAKKRFLRGLAMTMTPPTAPPAIQTMVEYAANKDFFSGREIVPDYMQALQPQLQFNNYTSDLAKRIGEITGWSPMVLDHFMNGLGASAYRDMVTMTNALNPNRPSMDETDAPILRRFVRDVRRGSASAQDFWAQASMVNGKMRIAEVTYKNLMEAGNPVAANKMLADLPEDERAYALLNAHFKADAKRLNPFYRGRQITTIVSAMRREIASDVGLEDTQPYGEGLIKLTAREKAEVDEVLSELARREIRNTLVATGTAGWTNKKQVDVESTLDLLEAVEPRVRSELTRRLTKAKVYDAQTVFEYWPEVKDRLLRDRDAAFLDDIVTIAKVMKR